MCYRLPLTLGHYGLHVSWGLAGDFHTVSTKLSEPGSQVYHVYTYTQVVTLRL